MEENSTSLQSTFKSNDTEETIDIYFTRPIGMLWARCFNAFNIHPNVVTILSIVIGGCSGIFMARGEGSWAMTLAGIALLMWANFYDSADGQLARMTGKKTLWGRILDGFAGNVWFISIYSAIALRLMGQPIVPAWSHSPQWGMWIWVFLAFVGFKLHGDQARLADYYRNIHLYFIKGASGSELDNAAALRQSEAQIKWSEQWGWKLFLKNYIAYTAAQEKATPVFQSFKQELDRQFGRNIPQDIVAEFRKGSLPLMKWTNALTFNWRAITLYVSLIVGIYVPWFVVVYPLIELTIFQLLYLHMRRSHEQLSARMHSRISS